MGKRWFFGRVVTPAQVFEQGAVGWEGEQILYAGPVSGADRDPRDSAEQVSGWVTPGLIDLHLRGAGGQDLSKILSVSKRRLRMMTLAPELPGALELLPALAEVGAVGSLGHTASTSTTAGRIIPKEAPPGTANRASLTGCSGPHSCWTTWSDEP